jgi:hypothetical protein
MCCGGSRSSNLLNIIANQKKRMTIDKTKRENNKNEEMTSPNGIVKKKGDKQKEKFRYW